jgi:hypothetical protein
MSFAQPWALLFLGLFVPVILLYLLKQRRRRVRVSTLLFWDKILRDEQTVTSLTKLKKLLSLLLQLLFIALLAFALARPMFSEGLTGARRILLLIDNSASMAVLEGGTQRFELAREKARGVVRGMAIGDTLMLATFASDVDVVHPLTDSTRDLQEAIDGLALTHGESDPLKVVRLIEQLAPDKRDTHVYLISDGAFEPVKIAPPSKTQFAYLNVGQAKENIGITAFQVRPLPSSPRDFQIHIEITNSSETDRTVPVELRIGGRLIDAFEFALPAKQSVTRVLKQFSSDGGQIEVFADAEDAFPLDNRAFATLPPPDPIRVKLVMEGNLFLESALLTDESVELEVITPSEYKESDGAVVTVFSNWAPEKTPAGNSIFISQWPSDLGLVRTGVVEKPLFTDWEREHPINRHLTLKNISIERAAALVPNSTFQKLASSFDDPLVLLRESPGQKTMVVTFDTLSTDLPLRVAFPIMIANAIRHLAGAEAGDRWQNPVIGDILSAKDLDRYVPVRQTNVVIGSIFGPGDRRIAFGASQLLPVSHVGFYQAELGGTNRTPLFAANLVSRVESRIQPSESLPLRADAPLPEIRRGFHLGWAPWILLVLFAAVLSTVEWGLFHRRVIE